MDCVFLAFRHLDSFSESNGLCNGTDFFCFPVKSPEPGNQRKLVPFTLLSAVFMILATSDFPKMLPLSRVTMSSEYLTILFAKGLNYGSR